MTNFYFTITELTQITTLAQKNLDEEFRKFFDKPAPEISTGLVRIVLEAAIEAGLVEVPE